MPKIAVRDTLSSSACSYDRFTLLSWSFSHDWKKACQAMSWPRVDAGTNFVVVETKRPFTTVTLNTDFNMA